jgi:hypothetical protein
MSVLEALKDAWGWAEIDFAEVHNVSPMGHLLFSDAEGCFHYLDPGLGVIEALGNEEAARVHFAMEKTREVWEARSLVAAARERLGECPEGSVYSLKPLALLQGDYSPDNFWICTLDELIRFTGDVARQTKDIPDGAQYRIEIGD